MLKQTIPSSRARFDKTWPEFVALVVGVGIGAYGNRFLEPLVATSLTKDTASIYGAVLALQGSLLGFVLAALTIVLGFSQSPQFKLLNDAGQLPTLFNVYSAGIRAHALSTGTALVALLLNSSSGLAPVFAWIVTTTCLLALVRLGRTLWATNNIVQALASDLRRQPGEL